jgi:hypothetical protein
LERPSLEYLAGFFDGEGNIGIYSGGGTGRTLRAQVTQADSEIARALLGYFKESWGGSVCRFNRALRRNAWNFQVGGDGARSLISDLRPHLILKAAQADLALLWFEARPQLTANSRRSDGCTDNRRSGFGRQGRRPSAQDEAGSGHGRRG